MYKFTLKDLLFFSGESEKMLVLSVASRGGGGGSGIKKREKHKPTTGFIKQEYERTLRGGGEIS